MEVGTDAIDWTKDPDHPDQRYRNRVEEGASLYEAKVSPTIPDRVRPFFMSIGVSETGVDFGVPDFSSFSPSGTSGNVSVYGLQDSSDSDAGRHGTNVAGIIAADLEDMGNAGLVNALSDFHGGANLDVGGGSIMVLPRLSRTERQLESGALVINWSWGLHKKGVIACTGAEVENNVVNSLRFARKAWLIRRFFENTLVSFPQAVIVATAGNGLTDAGDADARMPSSVVSPNMIVVGAHTTGGTVLDGAGNTHDEDVFASNFCFPEDRVGDGSIKRAWYSNFGHKVDISASGSIKGIRNVTHASQAQGTSFAAPLVSATIALMQSINPNLTPADVKSMLRSSALGMENEVAIAGSDAAEFATRPLSEDEKGAGHEDIGKGARLNVQGAIQAALDSLGDETLQIDEPYTINLGEGVDEVTVQISTVIPAEGAVFDKVDIMFLVDVSSSYNDDIATFRDKANELIDAFAGAGNNVQIGLASFSDYPQSPYGGSNDYEFRLDQPLTSDFDSIRTGLDALTILYGGDYPESQLEALNQTAQSDAGWRPGALPVIFLATDASFHNSDEESEYPGTGYDETLTTLNDGSITVFGFQSGGTLADVIQIATDTGGEAFVLSRDSAEIVAAVQDAIGAANSDLVVSLKPFGDFADLVRSITPADIVGAEPGDPITGVNPGDTVNFDVVFSRGIIDDGGSHTFSFRLRVVANDVAIIIEIPVTVILN
jgi:hypothetical protein